MEFEFLASVGNSFAKINFQEPFSSPFGSSLSRVCGCRSEVRLLMVVMFYTRMPQSMQIQLLSLAIAAEASPPACGVKLRPPASVGFQRFCQMSAVLRYQGVRRLDSLLYQLMTPEPWTILDDSRGRVTRL